MKNTNLSVVISLLFLIGCASTHGLVVYKVGCKTDPNFLSHEVQDDELEFRPEYEYAVCDKFKRYKVIRKNIVQEHLDGRKFKMARVEQFFYANYDKSRCELTIVTPLTGRAPDTTDSNHILNKYFYQPLLTRVSKPKDESIIKLKEMDFNSENNFQKYCKEHGF